jgi:hypothetical protein
LGHYVISIDIIGKKMNTLKMKIENKHSSRGALLFSLLVLMLLFSGALYAQERQAVLVRGNEWQAGIPGFGNNMFSALLGEYRVETAATAGIIGSFIVRASRVPLQFTEGLWQPWPGLDNAMQRSEDNSLLVAIPFDSPNSMGFWTIVFQFPQVQSGMNAAAITRLMGAWIRRFGHFFSLAKIFSDISLPAVVEF